MSAKHTPYLGLNIPTEIELILLLSKLRLSESEVQHATALLSSGQLNLELFITRSLGSHLAPLIHTSLKSINHEIPEESLALLKNAYNQVLVRNIRLYESFRNVLDIFNQGGIDCIPLKGIYLAEWLYDDIGLRHLSDIDLLVRSDDVATVCMFMHSNGWLTQKAKSRSEFEDEHFSPAHPYTFFKNGVTIELHSHLYNRNFGAKISETEIWEHTLPEKFNQIEIRQFSTEMLLQHLCLHLYKHIVGFDVKLVSFCDIRELIQQQDRPLNWNEFREKCERYDCLKEVGQILYISHKYWQTNVPSSFFLGIDIEPQIERKFVRFLSGKNRITQQLENTMDNSLTKLKSAKGIQAKVKFVSGFLFPSPVFMYHHFQLKESTWLLPWYVIRVFILSAKLVRAILNKIGGIFR